METKQDIVKTLGYRMNVLNLYQINLMREKAHFDRANEGRFETKYAPKGYATMKRSSKTAKGAIAARIRTITDTKEQLSNLDVEKLMELQALADHIVRAEGYNKL